MTPNLKYAAGLALTASIGAHLAGFGMTAGPEPTRIQGGAPQTVAMLGNSLANMVESVTQPVETPDPLTPKTPVAPDQVANAPVPELPPARPDDIAALPVGTAQAPITALPVAQASPEAVPPTRLAALTAVEPTPAKPVETAEPVKVTPETITSSEPVEQRPPRKTTTRPDHPKKAKPRKEPTRTAKAPSAPAARKGQADGRADAKASQSAKTSGKSKAAGNATVSNYPGKVMRKIQRTRQERAGARGTATVAFRITASGGVTSLRIQKSSGSARIDQIALRHIQRAAPFPPPPSGARTSFNLEIVSKG